MICGGSGLPPESMLMKDNQPSGKDEPLRKVLREWRVEDALPPRFQERVWARIKEDERVAPGIGATAWKWLVTALTRPAFATAYVAVFFLIGVGAGCEQGLTKTAHTESSLQ